MKCLFYNEVFNISWNLLYTEYEKPNDYMDKRNKEVFVVMMEHKSTLTQ